MSDLVEEDTDVVLIARQPVDGVSQHDVDGAGPEQTPDVFDSRPFERESARGVADRFGHRIAGLARNLDGRPLLSIEGSAIPLLGIGRHAAVDECSHGRQPFKSITSKLSRESQWYACWEVNATGGTPRPALAACLIG